MIAQLCRLLALPLFGLLSAICIRHTVRIEFIQSQSAVNHLSMLSQDTWQQMEKLVEEGLVKSIGISNFSVKKIEDLLQYAKIVPAVNQVELHPFFRNEKLHKYCNSKVSCDSAPICSYWQAVLVMSAAAD